MLMLLVDYGVLLSRYCNIVRESSFEAGKMLIAVILVDA